MTHDELCNRAAKWLRSRKPTSPNCWSVRVCKLVLREVVSSHDEIPDAIGWWGSGQSILVECKTSRADYMRDARKAHRNRESSMGAQRYFMTPPKLLSPDELPDGWGLLEVHGHSVKLVKDAVTRDLEPNGYRRELLLMMRGIRMINGEDDYPTKRSAAFVGEKENVMDKATTKTGWESYKKFLEETKGENLCAGRVYSVAFEAGYQQVIARAEKSEAGMLAVAHAIGIVHEADGHNDQPGPVDAIVQEIERLRGVDADRFIDAATPESIVDNECRRMGLDPEALAEEGTAFVATQHHPDILERIVEEEGDAANLKRDPISALLDFAVDVEQTPDEAEEELRALGVDVECFLSHVRARIAAPSYNSRSRKMEDLERVVEEEVAFHVDFWESMGRLVRDAWIEWAKKQPDVDKHPSWLVPWDDLPERDKEVDRRIAKRLFEAYDNAAVDALGKIAKMCGCPDWEYPAQVVRDVERELRENGR